MGSVSDMVDKYYGYEGITSELKLFYVFSTGEDRAFYDNDGYMTYLRNVRAYEVARHKYPRGAEIEDMRNV